MLHDDIGENISLKNPMYCELTAQYWAWKNEDADYYGFCHYRRYFSFSSQKLSEDVYGAINYDYLDETVCDELRLNDEQAITAMVSKGDFFVGKQTNLKKVKQKNLYTQYRDTPDLHIEDLKCAISVLKELYPDFAESADEYMNGHIFYPCNMFVMKKEIFFDYCEWLFNILGEVEKRIDISNYSIEGYRTIGHISERLLGIYYTYVKKHCQNCKTGFLQRTIIWNTEPFEYPKPFFTQKNVPVVFCCSDFFVPYVAATLQSLVVNSNGEENYDLLLLHTHISEKNQAALKKIFCGRENFSLRFLNISGFVEKSKLIANNHVSVETFYRLLANEIFVHYEKVLYLDSDIIVRRDVAELYNIDIGKNLIAATIDADHAGEYNGAIPKVKTYTDSVLKLKDPYKYFQAGVLIFNIAEMNKTFKKGELLGFAQKREYMYVDQDVLNVKCEGRVFVVDPRWNVMTDCNSFRMNGIIKRAPLAIYQQYVESRKDPYIIHYAGNEKPWNSPLSDMADYYWEYSRMTYFYEGVLWRMGDTIVNCHNASSSSILRKIADKLFPKGTKRREWIKAFFRIFRRV